MKIIDRLIGGQIRKPSGLFGSRKVKEHRALVDWMLEPPKIGLAHRMTDVRCGGGMTVRKIAGIARDRFVARLDHCEDMDREAFRQAAATVESGRVAIINGNVKAMPYDNASFDLVCGLETFYFWPDPVAGLKKIERVLKPGGQVAMVTDSSKRSTDPAVPEGVDERSGLHAYSGEETVVQLTEVGFASASAKEIPERAKGLLCAYGNKGRDNATTE